MYERLHTKTWGGRWDLKKKTCLLWCWCRYSVVYPQLLGPAYSTRHKKIKWPPKIVSSTGTVRTGFESRHETRLSWGFSVSSWIPHANTRIVLYSALQLITSTSFIIRNIYNSRLCNLHNWKSVVKQLSNQWIGTDPRDLSLFGARMSLSPRWQRDEWQGNEFPAGAPHHVYTEPGAHPPS